MMNNNNNNNSTPSSAAERGGGGRGAGLRPARLQQGLVRLRLIWPLHVACDIEM